MSYIFYLALENNFKDDHLYLIKRDQT